MTFSFRLQRLLALREEAEQAQARVVAGRQAEAAAARAARDQLAAHHADADAQARRATGAALVGHLQQFGTVVEALEVRVDAAGELVASAERAVADARELLEARARDRQVLDRLKDRQADAWRAEEAQRDRVLMDDIALGRHARRTLSDHGSSATGATARRHSPTP